MDRKEIEIEYRELMASRATWSEAQEIRSWHLAEQLGDDEVQRITFDMMPASHPEKIAYERRNAARQRNLDSLSELAKDENY